ncbi:hypothetical protein Tsubulata_039190 [Turnera subulata]|uniref:Uncharacterized protein n=1 Tax=Turnera subulata TaxID=218843 RepID=A0A9Q0F5Z5_9ROSI|nr:hypothetical protein Tsubulata_039190 [Turnera subulata]
MKVIKGTGKRGIRTLGTKNSYNGLAIRRFSPLSHLSQLKKVNYPSYITLLSKGGQEKKRCHFSVSFLIITPFLSFYSIPTSLFSRFYINLI